MSGTNKSALASLTATYTDSENEDDNHSDDDTSHTDGSTESQVIIPVQSRPSTPSNGANELHILTPPPPTQSSKPLRLVSYNDDTLVSDDENTSPNRDSISMDISDEEQEAKGSDAPVEDVPDKYTQWGFNLPPESKGKCPTDLQEKINNHYDKIKTSNMDMNTVIQKKKGFRNPSIYDKLIEFCNIDELGTNYSPEIYDPLQWGKESFYEELAKAQKTEMDKRERDRKDNAKVEAAVAAAKKVEEEAKKRKSKWDQPAPVVSQVANVKAAGLLPPALTANVTGTKSTIISAFGSLPKKPKA